MFSGIATTFDYERKLAFQYRYDKLGMDQRLKELEELQASHEVEELHVLGPMLRKIAARSQPDEYRPAERTAYSAENDRSPTRRTSSWPAVMIGTVLPQWATVRPQRFHNSRLRFSVLLAGVVFNKGKQRRPRRGTALDGPPVTLSQIRTRAQEYSP